MKTIRISTHGRIKLNSFHPLCKNVFGLKAIQTFGYPPFIDASCRRETDFENSYPSISALCRQGAFAPHLRPKDIVVYMTVGGVYPPFDYYHHRLVAILQVEEVYNSHAAGEVGYNNLKVNTPSNCMVQNNKPFDFEHTAGYFATKKELNNYLSKPTNIQKSIGNRLLSIWDKSYLDKSQKWECFVRTKPIFLNLTNPSIIRKEDFIQIFDKMPNTRTPKIISEKEFRELGKLSNLNIVPKETL